MDMKNIKTKFEKACKDNDINTIKELFDTNQDIKIYEPGYYNLALYGHLETLEYLLDNTKPELINDHLKHMIIVNAIDDNNINVVKMMLQKYIINFNYVPLNEEYQYHKTLIDYCKCYSLDEYIWLFEEYIIPKCYKCCKCCKCCKNVKETIIKFNRQYDIPLLNELLTNINIHSKY